MDLASEFIHVGNYFAGKFRLKNILVLRNSWSIVDVEHINDGYAWITNVEGSLPDIV